LTFAGALYIPRTVFVQNLVCFINHNGTQKSNKYLKEKNVQNEQANATTKDKTSIVQKDVGTRKYPEGFQGTG
jgi:hypothetical protein